MGNLASNLLKPSGFKIFELYVIVPIRSNPTINSNNINQNNKAEYRQTSIKMGQITKNGQKEMVKIK